MKIHLASDLHLHCGYATLPGGDLLILAGDIAEAEDVQRDARRVKNSHHYVLGTYANSDFFQVECAKYNRVLYVLGNHEAYDSRLDKARGQLEAIIPDNVQILENESVEIDGILFVGATLWTDANRRDPLTMQSIGGMMNDYFKIKFFDDKHNVYRKLKPYDTVMKHQETVQYLNKTLTDNRSKRTVVITHHAPSFASVPPQFIGDREMNGAYASDLSDLILDNPQIEKWLHGHMHDPVDYVIGTTRIISNPRGYLGYEAEASHWKILEIEV